MRVLLAYSPSAPSSSAMRSSRQTFSKLLSLRKNMLFTTSKSACFKYKYVYTWKSALNPQPRGLSHLFSFCRDSPIRLFLLGTTSALSWISAHPFAGARGVVARTWPWLLHLSAPFVALAVWCSASSAEKRHTCQPPAPTWSAGLKSARTRVKQLTGSLLTPRNAPSAWHVLKRIRAATIW